MRARRRRCPTRRSSDSRRRRCGAGAPVPGVPTAWTTASSRVVPEVLELGHDVADEQRTFDEERLAVLRAHEVPVVAGPPLPPVPEARAGDVGLAFLRL